MKNRKIELNTDLRAGEILSLVGIIVLAIMIGMILSSQVFTIAGVREVSMEDTLFEGERIFVNKLVYRGSIPDRGDVVIFLKGEEINGF
ncbi:MAG TPA: S26 family signal peptidase, partial [Clostridia bacterium]|nr:S26 family signal peptidase [Clostridia bacterium]